MKYVKDNMKAHNLMVLRGFVNPTPCKNNEVMVHELGMSQNE